jgi:hypothetical protein
MKVSPNSLKNLKLITSETARENQRKSVQSRLLNLELQQQFKVTAKAFMKIKEDLPDITALDILKMAMHLALQEDKMDDAARYASQIAEYEQPKLQRIDQSVTTKTADLTDEELLAIIEQEGLQKNPTED